MSKSKIDWPGLTHTWNMYKGCKHGCKDCIAETWNKRYKWVEKWNEPVFFPENMGLPYNHKKPCRIFVNFVGDLFGDWVEGDIIRQVLKVCADNPQHEFLFLTKNPRRYKYLKYPSNCWLGISITGEENVFEQYVKYSNLVEASKYNRMFLSVEPLRGYLKFDVKNSDVDLVIVGAQTNPDLEPKKGWIDSVEHKNIYYKKNIRKYLNDKSN